MAPFIDSFSPYGELTVNMGYQFTPGLLLSMINSTVLRLQVESRNSPPVSVNYTWNVISVGNKTFTLALKFEDIKKLSLRDVFRM